MAVIGLTGSIATGKSFVAEIFKEKAIKIFDSDYEVAGLLKDADVINAIKNTSELTAAIIDRAVDKAILSKMVFADHKALQALENIIHPIIAKKVENFIESNSLEKFIVIEVPLLFEKKYQKYCHKVITTHCIENVQRKRALERKNIDNVRFDFIVKQQMPIHLKALLTDYIVYTDVSDEYTKKQIEEILHEKRNNS